MSAVRSAADVIDALLAKSAVVFETCDHEPVSTIEEAKLKVPHLTVDLLKTVVFRVHQTERIVLVAVACERAVDYKKVSQQLGCSRRALRLMPPDQVEAELGFEIGGVGPFPVADSASVLLDAGIEPSKTIRVGGGLRTRTLALKFSDLVTVSDAHVAEVSK